MVNVITLEENKFCKTNYAICDVSFPPLPMTEGKGRIRRKKGRRNGRRKGSRKVKEKEAEKKKYKEEGGKEREKRENNTLFLGKN
jgi:hypothetical protein